jgi:hypothetical protein
MRTVQALDQIQKELNAGKSFIDRLKRMVNQGGSLEASQVVELKATLACLIAENKPLTPLEESLILMQMANYLNHCRGTGIS